MTTRYQVLSPDGSVYFDADTVDWETKARNRVRSTPISPRKVAERLAKDESGPDGVFTAAPAV